MRMRAMPFTPSQLDNDLTSAIIVLIMRRNNLASSATTNRRPFMFMLINVGFTLVVFYTLRTPKIHELSYYHGFYTAFTACFLKF